MAYALEDQTLQPGKCLLKEHPAVLVSMATILVAFLLLATNHPTVTLLAMCGLSVVPPYYTMIHLYRKNDKMMGGLPTANSSYAAGYIALAAGFLLLAASFLDGNDVLGILGAVSLMSGFGFAIIASRLLFQQAVRRGLRST